MEDNKATSKEFNQKAKQEEKGRQTDQVKNDQKRDAAAQKKEKDKKQKEAVTQKMLRDLEAKRMKQTQHNVPNPPIGSVNNNKKIQEMNERERKIAEVKKKLQNAQKNMRRGFGKSR